MPLWTTANPLPRAKREKKQSKTFTCYGTRPEPLVFSLYTLRLARCKLPQRQAAGTTNECLLTQTILQTEEANTIADDLAPWPSDVVIVKEKASAFFGPQLVSILNYEDIDTTIFSGMVTSGCVRATAVDSFQYNYKVILPLECVADRGKISRRVNLIDIEQKYPDCCPWPRYSPS